MKKSFKFIVVSISILFILSSVSFAFEGNWERDINLKADTFMNFNSEMLKQNKLNNTKNITCSIVNLKEIDFSNIQGKLIGSLNYNNGEVVDFELVGKLKNRGKDNDVLVIADLKDSLDNFEVINCSLSIAPEKMNLFNKEEYLKNKHQINTVMSLILKEKQTNRLTYLDWFSPNINIDTIVKNQNILPKIDKKEMLWHKKILDIHPKISKYKSFDKDYDNEFVSSYDIKSTRSYDTENFYVTYEYMDETYKQKLSIKHYLDVPNELDGTGLMSGWIKVLSNTTECTSDSAYSTDDSYLSIGRGGDTTFQFLLQGDSSEAGGDAFKTAQWDANGITAPEVKVGADIDLSYAVAVPYTPLSFSIGFTPSQAFDLNDTYNSFTNDFEENELTRVVKVVFNKEYMIHSPAEDNKEAHKFTVDLNVRKYDEDNPHNNGEIEFKYSYFVWDQFGYDHTSHSDTIYDTYISN